MSPIPGEVTIKLMINIFSNDLLVGTFSSLTIIRLNLVNNASNTFIFISFS